MHDGDMTATQVVDLRTDIVNKLGSTYAQQAVRVFAEMFSERNLPFDWRSNRDPKHMAATLKDTVAAAQLAYVTADMVQTAAGSASGLVGMPLFRHDVPALPMWVVLDQRPMPTFTDVDGTKLGVKAFLLFEQQSLVEQGDTVFGSDGIGIMPFMDTATVKQVADEQYRDDLQTLGNVELDDLLRRLGRAYPSEFIAWAYDTEWSIVDDDAPQTQVGVSERIASMRTFVHSVLLLMSEVSFSDTEPVPHPTVRRSTRAGINTPNSIVVCRVRRVEKPSSGNHSTGHFSHRWGVRGHWRRIQRGTPKERAVWVRPHVKGPQDAEFVPKDNLITLAR